MTIYSDLLDAYNYNKSVIDNKVDKANAEGAAAKALFAYKAESDADGKKISTTYLKVANFNTYKTATDNRLNALETTTAEHTTELEDHETRIDNVETNYLKKTDAARTYALLKHYPTLTGDYASKTIIDYITDEDEKQNTEIDARALSKFYPNLTGSYANKTIINYINDKHQAQEAHLTLLDEGVAGLDDRLETAENNISASQTTITSNTNRISALETHLENDYYTKTDINDTRYTKAECDRKFALKSYYPNLTGEFRNQTIIDYIDTSVGSLETELHNYYSTSSEVRDLVSNSIDQYDRTTVRDLDNRVSSLEEITTTDSEAQIKYAKAQYYPDSIGMSILQYLAQNYVSIGSMDGDTYDFISEDEVRDILTNYMTRTELANTYITKTNAVEVFLPREDFEAVLDGAGINPNYFVSKTVYEAEKANWATKSELNSAINGLSSTYATRDDVNTAVASKASASELNALRTTYLNDKANTFATKTEVSQLRSDIAGSLGNYATTARVNSVESSITDLETTLTDKINDLDDKTVKISDYTNDQSTIDGRITSLASSKLDLATWDNTIDTLATKEYVDDAVAGVIAGEGFVSQDEFNNFVDQYYDDRENLFVTQTSLNTVIASAKEEITTEISSAGYLTGETVGEYLTNYVTAEGLAEQLANYATTSDIENFITAEDIPTLVSAFENDAGYITSADLATYARASDIPTSLSDLSDDIGIVTSEDLASDLDDIQSTYVRISGNRGNLGGYGVANAGEISNGETLTLSATSRDTVIRSTSGNITLTFTPSEEATTTATKVIALYATNTTTLTITGAVWVDDGVAPAWGTTGNSLIIVASFVNSAVYLNVFHNSEA